MKCVTHVKSIINEMLDSCKNQDSMQLIILLLNKIFTMYNNQQHYLDEVQHLIQVSLQVYHLAIQGNNNTVT